MSISDDRNAVWHHLTLFLLVFTLWEEENHKKLSSAQIEAAEPLMQGTRTTISVVYPGILFGGGGVQQIQLRTERTGIWGMVAP